MSDFAGDDCRASIVGLLVGVDEYLKLGALVSALGFIKKAISRITIISKICPIENPAIVPFAVFQAEEHNNTIPPTRLVADIKLIMMVSLL